MNKFVRPAVIPALALSLGGCSWIMGSSGPTYSENGAQQQLAVPPNLLTPKTTSTYAVPPAPAPGTTTPAATTPPPVGGTSATQSAPAAAATPAPVQAGVLPQAAGMHLMSHKGVQWLSVAATPGAVWPQVLAYYKAQGFKLTESNAKTGLIRTDWKMIGAGVPKGLTGRLFKNLYDSGKRERYVVRLVSHQDGAGTLIYVSYQGAIEEHIGSGAMHWQWAPPNPGKEATALQSLMNYLSDHLKVNASPAPASASAPMVPPAPATSVPTAGVMPTPQPAPAIAAGVPQTEPSDYTILSVNEQPVMRSALPFDTAWPQIGLALGREYFTITQADKAKGLYHVTYAGQNHGNTLSNMLGAGTVMSMGTRFIIVVRHRAQGVQVEVDNPMMLPVENDGAEGILQLIRSGMVGPHRRAAAASTAAAQQQQMATQAQGALKQAETKTGTQQVQYALVSESYEPVLRAKAPLAVVWPQVGLALMHSHFVIAAQDAAKGTYQVIYEGKNPKGGGSFISNLVNGGPVLFKGVRFRIYVQQIGPREVWVHAQNQMGLPLPAHGARSVLKSFLPSLG